MTIPTIAVHSHVGQQMPYTRLSLSLKQIIELTVNAVIVDAIVH